MVERIENTHQGLGILLDNYSKYIKQLYKQNTFNKQRAKIVKYHIKFGYKLKYILNRELKKMGIKEKVLIYVMLPIEDDYLKVYTVHHKSIKTQLAFYNLPYDKWHQNSFIYEYAHQIYRTLKRSGLYNV